MFNVRDITLAKVTLAQVTLTLGLLCMSPVSATAETVLQESSFWAAEVEAGLLPPIERRLPEQPLVVDLAAKGRKIGQQGGVLRTMVSRKKDIRQMVPFGYARLVGYDENYGLTPDILARVDTVENRVFTLHLRRGHRWSDGALFTSADFEYWWVHVANNAKLMPSGPPDFLRVHGELPVVTFPDAQTITYAWSHPNTAFLPALAQARPPFIFRPAHYLKHYHLAFTSAAKMQAKINKMRVHGWAAMHNKLDNMYKFDNPDLPTLQPWMSVATNKSSRRFFVHNPYYHRIDTAGVQLPYIDTIEMSIVGAGLIAAKSNAGEADLQARGLSFKDMSILKKGEVDGDVYRTLLWANGAASQIAIYPNLNYTDPVWRKVLRDVRFRRALSLAIDRRMINRALYFGLAVEGGMSVQPTSPFFKAENLTAWATLDIERANGLLDDMGLIERTRDGIRKLPDGRPLQIVIETAGERAEVENALQISTDTWREIGVRLLTRPLSRDTLRRRVNAGVTMASVWYGWDNGIPSRDTSPSYLAPRQQEFFAWPKWGQYYQTGGDAGEKPDMPAPLRLLELADEWEYANSEQKRATVWAEMLKIHAEQVFAIGIVTEAPQPIVVSKRLRNIPEQAIWAWDPGAQFGVHRPDEFFFDQGENPQ